MINKKVKLEIEGFNIVEEVSNEQFAIVEVYVAHDGNNKHNLPIALSVLKRAAKTLKNKPLVAGFDGNDFEGHEPDETPVGVFPESTKISYKKKGNKTYLVAEAIMWKQYAQWAYDRFVESNYRNVSMEIEVLEFGDVQEDGLQDINSFVFSAVTILGGTHRPACEGADASIIKFTEKVKENASKYYGKYSWESNLVLDLEGVNTGKEGTEDMGDNKEKEVINDVVVETPEVIEDTVVETVEEVTAEPTAEAEAEVVVEEVAEEAEFEKTEDKDEDTDDKATMEDDDKEDSDEDADDDKDEDDKEEMSDEAEVKCEASEEGADTNVPSETITEEGGEVTPAGEAEVVEDVVNPEVEALQEKVAELEKIVAEFEAEKHATQVEAILASEDIAEVLSTDQKTELREKAKTFSLDNLNTFANEVKALAFEQVKKENGKYSFAKMPMVDYQSASETTGRYSW